MGQMQVSFSGTEEEVLSQMRRFINAYRALDSKKKITPAEVGAELDKEREDSNPAFPHVPGSLHVKTPSNYPPYEAKKGFWELAQKKNWSVADVTNYMRTRWPEADGKVDRLQYPQFNELLNHVFKTDLNTPQV